MTAVPLADDETLVREARCLTIRNHQRITRRARCDVMLTDRRLVAVWGGRRRRLFLDVPLADIDTVAIESSLRLPGLFRSSGRSRTYLLLRLTEPPVSVALLLSIAEAEEWGGLLAEFVDSDHDLP